MTVDTLLEFVGNHPMLFAAVGVILVLFVINEFMIAFSGDQRIDPATAVRLINDSGARVLDVRQPTDFKKGHILDAINIPLNRIEARIDELGDDQDKPVIVYCALGSLAPQACVMLRNKGFGAVHAIRGGITAWQSAGLPVTTK